MAGAPPPPGTYTNVKKPKTTKKTSERPGTMPLGKPQPIDPIEAEKAKLDFLQVFQLNKNPEDIDIINVNSMPLPNLLKHIGFVASTSEARRLISQKALKIDDKIVNSIEVDLKEGVYLLKLGKKKFIKVNITND